MESTRLLLNEALAPYRVALSPCGAHGECLVSVSNVEEWFWWNARSIRPSSPTSRC